MKSIQFSDKNFISTKTLQEFKIEPQNSLFTLKFVNCFFSKDWLKLWKETNLSNCKSVEFARCMMLFFRDHLTIHGSIEHLSLSKLQDSLKIIIQSPLSNLQLSDITVNLSITNENQTNQDENIISVKSLQKLELQEIRANIVLYDMPNLNDLKVQESSGKITFDTLPLLKSFKCSYCESVTLKRCLLLSAVKGNSVAFNLIENCPKLIHLPSKFVVKSVDEQNTIIQRLVKKANHLVEYNHVQCCELQQQKSDLVLVVSDTTDKKWLRAMRFMKPVHLVFQNTKSCEWDISLLGPLSLDVLDIGENAKVIQSVPFEIRANHVFSENQSIQIITRQL